MKAIFGDTNAGRKNIGFGLALFLVLGVGAGIPLTIDFFGGSVFRVEQYQMWKVVHGYGVFLSFINYFFGLLIDQMELPKLHKEISSWSILMAGLFGGVTRSILLLVSALNEYGVYASLGEAVFISLGTLIFLRGLVTRQRYPTINRSALHSMRQSDDAFSKLVSDTSRK